MKNGSTMASDVDPAKIAPDALIYPGCRIYGKKTSIGSGCIIGAEGPVTIENCQLGRRVELKGGFFSGSVFLDGASMGSGGHVRAGTILEEEANGAHAVGLKQTVLFPYVTLGSLINFCDILMAGGTDRKNHGEVGSSYIHFNFTPHQDKATASLIGDVPRGVLLNQRPVFLGGQGGLVGPARIAFGTVIAAGGVCRGDVLEENGVHVPPVPETKTAPYDPGVYKRIDRIVRNNLVYIGNIRALKAWYQNIRVYFIRDGFDRACFDGAIANLHLILEERIKRLGELAGKMDGSSRILAQKGAEFAETAADQLRFSNGWEMLRMQLETRVDPPAPAGLLQEIEHTDRSDYPAAMKRLSENARSGATEWLQGIVNTVVSEY